MFCVTKFPISALTDWRVGLPHIAGASKQTAEKAARIAAGEVDELAAYGDRVSVRSRDETAIHGYRAKVDTLLAVPRENTLVYCCGPEPLLAAVEKRCATWPPRSLHVERFSPKPLTEPGLSGASEVVLQRSELKLTVPPDRSA